MEAASVPADAGQATGAPEGGGEEQGQEQQGQEFAPLLDRFGEMEKGLTERLDGMEERFSQAGESGQPAEVPQEGQESIYVDPETGQVVDEFGNPQGEGDQYLDLEAYGEKMRTEARQEMQQQLAPILDRFRDQDLAGLEQKYPELQTEEGARPVVAAAQTTAERLSQGNSQLADYLLDQPGFVELAFLAEKAKQSAAGETPAGATSGAQLETGAGPAPQEGQPQSTWDRIADEQAPGSKFWGV